MTNSIAVGLSLALAAALLLIVYALTFVNWRAVVRFIGFVFVAVGTRLMEWSLRPSTPVGAKAVIRIQKRWERQHVEMRRDEDGVVIMAGGRFFRVKP